MPFRRLPLLILLSFPVALAAQSSAEWSTFRTAAASAGPRSSSAVVRQRIWKDDMSSRTALCLLGMAGTLDGSLAGQQTIPTEPGRHRVEIPSSIDRSFQPAYLTLPTSRDSAAPLAVLLHTWSTTLEQRNRTVEVEAEARGWLLLAQLSRSERPS